MSVFSIKVDTEKSYIVWLVSETEAELKTLATLSFQEKLECSKISDKERYMQWLSARVALKFIVESRGGKYYGLNKDPNGKPFLVNSSDCISIAHCKKYVAATLSGEFVVGVDVQECTGKIFLIKEKFLSKEELSYPNLGIDKLCVMWSAKETIYKIFSGRGISFKGDILIRDFILQNEGTLEAYCKESKISVGYEIFDSHVFSFAAMT